MAIDSVLAFAHHLVTKALSPGETAVDATLGNGHDTVVLSEAVGKQGDVYGFDVQAEAIARTEDRLATETASAEIHLHHVGHEEMTAYLPEERRGTVGAVMFNLGYLPGSTSSRTTRPETTIPGLSAAVELLRPGGVITIVIYTGHDGGPEEADAVDTWATALSQQDFHVLSYRFMNRKNNPPRLVAIEKRPEDTGS